MLTESSGRDVRLLESRAGVGWVQERRKPDLHLTISADIPCFRASALKRLEARLDSTPFRASSLLQSLVPSHSWL